VPEPYLCRSFAGIENPISSYSTTVKPLMLAKFKLKNIKMRERKKKANKKEKRAKPEQHAISISTGTAG